MLNILDVGGSFGIVTIAAMKKYPERLRAITVEASPTMFFYLKCNLAINGIP
jgi:tRNA1(Val) A37 N6-methylase TrmN6